MTLDSKVLKFCHFGPQTQIFSHFLFFYGVAIDDNRFWIADIHTEAGDKKSTCPLVITSEI